MKKLEKMALSGLMLNINGPSRTPRVLYANVVQGVLLYAAPVWHEIFYSSKRHWGAVAAVQRRISQRIISEYCTMSERAAGLLAGILPIDLIAHGHAQAYEWKMAARNNTRTEECGSEEIKIRMQTKIYAEWEARTSVTAETNPVIITSQRIRAAFQDRIRMWKERKHGTVDFWMIYGSFGTYIHIRKSDTKRC